MSLCRLIAQAAQTVYSVFETEPSAPVKGLQYGATLGLVEQQNFAVAAGEFIGISAGDEFKGEEFGRDALKERADAGAGEGLVAVDGEGLQALRVADPLRGLLADEEVAAEVAAAVAASGAAGPQDMGKVMAIVKPKLAGRADMTVVSALVKKALTPAA